MTTPKLYFIRGQRILNQLNETTFNTLEKNTRGFTPPSSKRQHSTDPIQVTQIKLMPYVSSNALEIEALTASDGKKYETTMLFQEVEFQDSDEANNTSFVASDKDEYHISPIKLSSNNVKVRCTCMDFRWRFAMWNNKDKSLYGNPPPPYKKVSNRGPSNPQKVPGVCKHLLKATQALKQSGLLQD